MILIRENVEIHTTDKDKIDELKADGFTEVKTDDSKPKRKRGRKTAKTDK